MGNCCMYEYDCIALEYIPSHVLANRSLRSFRTSGEVSHSAVGCPIEAQLFLQSTRTNSGMYMSSWHKLSVKGMSP